MTNKSSVDQEITELINIRRVEVVENVPYVVNALSVSKKNDTFKLNLDLRHVNMHVYRDKIKFEDWDDIKLFEK